ncbi:MAG: CHAT domain-containing protein [Hyphomicrobiaceae bacterium]|nr:CHAT domain-containing protein [Hyphomicrobiaceae bacterium]
MVARIKYSELERMLADDTVPDQDIATYLMPSHLRSLPFVPTVAVDETLVELPPTRGIIGLTVKSLNDRANRRRRAAFKQRIDAGWKGLRLLAEGDSWFLYPVLLRDVVDNLEEDYAILSDAAAGDTLDGMLGGLDALAELIDQHQVHAMLLSAGGNDIAGEPLRRYLEAVADAGAEPSAYIGHAFDDFLDETRDRLRVFFSELMGRQPELRIFCHGYDWPRPRAGGHWLAPAMTALQIRDDAQPAILKLMIDRYYDMLLGLQQLIGERLIVVDVRGIVGDGPEWFDELHPNNAGFSRVADRFRAAINAAYGIGGERGTVGRTIEVTVSREWEPTSQAIRLSFPVGSTVMIGRNPECDVVVTDETASRRHARLNVGPALVQVDDMDSRNGTYIDGAQITMAPWRPGQKLRIGSQVLSLAYRETGDGGMEIALPRRAERLQPMPEAGDEPRTAGQGLDTQATAVTPQPRVEIEVIHANIADVRAPAYVLGVFQNINPLSSRGACSAIDAQFGGVVSLMAQGGTFSAQLGEVSVLPYARHRGVMELIMLAGLGALSTFAARSLEIVGEQVARTLLAAKIDEIATVPIGGNAGIPVRSFVEHFLSGLLKGLSQSQEGRRLRKVRLCEVDRDRFDALESALKELTTSDPFAKSGVKLIMHDHGRVAGERAAAPRPDAKQLAPIYLQVSSPSDGVFDYFILSAALGAAIPSHRLEIPAPTLAAMAVNAAKAPRFDAATGGQLAATYLPAALQEQIKLSLSSRASHLVIIHDRASSAIPWETFYLDGQCPALEQGISRLYRLGTRERARARPPLLRGATMRMLVVENPTGDLAGASNEGAALAQLFASRQGDVKVLKGAEASRNGILGELTSGTYDLLHYAGHADFDESRPEASGLLCSDGRLTTADLREVGRVPQLIFLNACESGRLRKSTPDADDRGSLLGTNVGLAEGFLLGGVANFIGTYWPVNDAAALRFSTTFYQGLLSGLPMGEALRAGRREIMALGPRDWANYLHFGDPLYAVRQA